MIKLMFCLRRRPDLTREEFQEYWRGKHGALGVSLAGDLGYRRYVQSHTLETELNLALESSRGAPEAFDGVVELWFDDLAAVRNTFAGPAGRAAAKALLQDEHNFVDLAASPIFVVGEHQLWPAEAEVSADSDG